ncbi:hypothetical protein EDD11_006869 [Mortierella claussenii]|nr:hypothetical protein EDD11_006869 [Mortierella claussenii]
MNFGGVDYKHDLEKSGIAAANSHNDDEFEYFSDSGSNSEYVSDSANSDEDRHRKLRRQFYSHPSGLECRSPRHMDEVRGSLKGKAGNHDSSYPKDGSIRRLSGRDVTWAYGEEQCPWSPWSRWRLILKLLYAVVVPVVIIWLLRRFDQSLQSQSQSQSHRHQHVHRNTHYHYHTPAPLSSTRSGTVTAATGAVHYQGQQVEVTESKDGPPRHQGRDEIISCKSSVQKMSTQGGSSLGQISSRSLLSTLTGLLLQPLPSRNKSQWWHQLQQQQHPHSHLEHQSQDRDRHPKRHSDGSIMVQQTSFDQFLLFGDSITQYSFDVNERGFGAQLAHLFQRRLDLINRGFSGYTSEQAIHLLPQFLPHAQDCQQEQQDIQSSVSSSSLTSQPALRPPPKIQFLSIFFGANDACIHPSPQHVDLSRYEHNMRSLIDMVHHPDSPTYSPGTRVIVICPPPIDEAQWAIRRKERGMAMDRNKDVTRQYSEKCRTVAQEYQSKYARQQDQSSDNHHHYHQIDVIDTWTLMMDQMQNGQRTLDDYLKDGLHLASAGNDVCKNGLSRNKVDL